MKKIVLSVLVVFVFQLCVCAQPPQGGGRRGGGNMGGAPPGRGMMAPDGASKDELILEYFPEIPKLTLEQRARVSEILAKEQKEVMKKHEKMRKNDESFRLKNNPSDKEVANHKKQVDKTREQIKSVKEKSDKRIKKILSDEQYSIFKEKREDFKFRREGGKMKQPPQNDERGKGMENKRPPHPTM